uniref:Translation initiation factor eIF2B subunit epsilon n=2 Tax=Guillardia theta TaxID=55529 RepID=A0A7S4KCD1_GUITH
MSGKDKKKPGTKKSDIDDGDEALQAILLADSFRKRMAPTTYTTPKILLPLVNIPIIEYTLELLVQAGVKELFIVASSHAEKIQEYVLNSKSCKQFEVEVIVAPAVKSLGGALREVDSRGKIRSDFILVNGDTLSNIKLEPVLQAHKKRREEEKNKDAIMTLVFKTSLPQQRMATFPEDDICVAINPETNQLVHYQPMTKKGFQIDSTRFEAHPTVSVRYDLEYAHAAICSPEVLCLFTDEFDWQDLHTDYIPGVLYSEILSYQLFAYIVTEGYSGRLTSLHQYATVSMDVIRRWSYPLVPDVNLFCDTTYEYLHPGVYKEANVSLAQSCIIGMDTVIGSKTVVGEGAKIDRSVIGRSCVIGDGAVLEGCFLFANVKIGAGAILRDCLLADDVEVGEKAVIEKNCILGGNVKISSNVTVREGTRVTVAERPCDAGDDDDDFGDDDETVQDKVESKKTTDLELVGADGRGRKWEAGEDEQEALIAPLVMEKLFDSDNSDEEEDESDSEDEGGGACQSAASFEREVEDIVRRGVEEGVLPENISMEVNGRKFAHDKTFADCSCIIFVTILNTMTVTSSRKEAFANAVKLIKTWKPLLSKFARSVNDQKETMVALESFVSQPDWKGHKLMMPILKCCYDEDVFEEDAIFLWSEDAQGRSEESKGLVEECKALLDYLKEDEDEDEDED